MLRTKALASTRLLRCPAVLRGGTWWNVLDAVLRDGVLFNTVSRACRGAGETMPMMIQDKRYFMASEAAEAAQVSRHTIYRWRQDGKIPAGRRYRDGRVLYTEEELETIREYANRLEPIGPADFSQLRLFNKH